MAKEKGIINGFKTFIMRGNVVDLAVGVVIGAAFGAVVTALVEKILMPLIAAVFGAPNFDEALQFTLNGSTILVGAFITAVINFLLIALGVYLFLVLPMNKLNEIRDARNGAATEEEPEKVADDVQLLTEIRDLLARK